MAPQQVQFSQVDPGGFGSGIPQSSYYSIPLVNSGNPQPTIIHQVYDNHALSMAPMRPVLNNISGLGLGGSQSVGMGFPGMINQSILASHLGLPGSINPSFLPNIPSFPPF